jgi:protein O-mannosyl-transferase
VLAATVAAYLPALRGGPIWDDDFHITRPALRSLAGLWRIWTDVGATPQYYPVLHSAFWLEHRLWGDAFPAYHLVNVFLHAASACVFGLILRQLGFGKPFPDKPWVPGAPLVGALLFALHPVCVESVAWISEQKNTLSTLFALLAALFFLGWRLPSGQAGPNPTAGRASARYWLASLLFLLALLSKSVTATVPGALLVVLWWKKGRLSWREDVLPLAPWLALGLAGGLLGSWVETHSIGASGSEFALAPLARVLVAGRVAWFYLGKLLWPSALTFIYPRWAVDPAVPWQYLFPLAAAGLIAALAMARARGALAAVLVFGGSLFPVMGFLNVYPFRYSFVADHFQYLASLGIFALAAGAWETWARRPGASAAALLPIPLACLLGGLTWNQSGMYRDAETLYSATIDRNPDCWMAYNNLGALMMGRGRSAEALPYYEKVLGYRPSDAIPHNNLGIALAGTGRLDEAIAQFREAVRLKLDYAEAHDNLAIALRREHRSGESLAECDAALAILPSYAQARADRARALLQSGRLDEAIADFRAAIVLEPGVAEAHADLAMALGAAERLPEAIVEYARALDLKPGYAEAANNMGVALAQAGRLPEALDRFEQAVCANPAYADARDNLALVLRSLGRGAEADAQAAEAARLRGR